MRIVLVYNSKAGGDHTMSDLQALCRRHDIAVEKYIKADGSLARHLRPYLDKSITIAVSGGDGTISTVAALLVGKKASLAPLPGGTLNHFVKDLGISPNLDQAVANVAASTISHVDVGLLNERIFINNSSIGLYPSSLAERDALERHIGKWPAAVIAAFKAFLRFRLYTVTIGDESFYTPFVFVGNNNYHLDTLGAAERRSLADGVLSVFIARTTSRRRFLKIALLTLIGKSTQLHEFDERTLTSLTIEAKAKRIRVACDGELYDIKSPLRYTIRPSALKVRK